MTVYATPITTNATNAKDAYSKVQAYRQLFNISHNDVLTYVKGVFYDNQGDCCFLLGYARLVTITARSIKWYDPATLENIIIVSSDTSFELTLRV